MSRLITDSHNTGGYSLGFLGVEPVAIFEIRRPIYKLNLKFTGSPLVVSLKDWQLLK